MSIKYLALFFFFMPTVISAQNIEWVADTIFTKSISLKDATLLYNSENSIVINTQGIRPFHKISAHVSAFFQKKYLVKIDDLAYVLNEDLSINLEEGLDLDFSNISKYKARLGFKGKTITYVIDHLVFVDNFKDPDKTMITTYADPRIDNEEYITIEKGYPEEVHVYDIKAKKLNKLPTGFGTIKSINPDFVLKVLITLDSGYKIDVYDIKTKKIIDQKEGYQKYIVNQDLLAVFGGRKSPKFWCKGKSIKLPPNIVDIEIIENSNLCVVKNKKGKYGIMEPTGKMILPFQFDMCNPSYFFSKVILAKKGKHSYILNRSGKQIFKGEYDQVYYLCPDRFRVKSRKGQAVVNTKGEIIIPFMRGGSDGLFSYRNENGKEVIFWQADDKCSIYTLDGKFIMEYEKKLTAPRSVSESYLSGYPFSVIRNMNEQQLALLNPLDIWIASEKINGKWQFSLEDHDGNKITEWYLKMKKIKGTNSYIVQTKSNKYGVLQIK